MKNRPWLIIGIIIALAVAFRLINFASNPPSLYWDEVAIGLDARSLIATGKDLSGQSWLQPLFYSYGDYKAPIYIWLVTLLGKLFPINELTVRLPSLLAFIGLCLSFYLLLKEISPKKSLLPYLGLISLTIMPWSYHFSRIGMESYLSLLWLTLSLYLLISGIKRSKPLNIVLAGLSLSLGIYSYIALRIIGPILFTLTFLIYRFPRYSASLKSFLLSLTIILTSIYFLTTSSSYQPSQQYRLSNNNLVKSTKHILQSVVSLNAYPQNSLFPRLVHHRYIYKLKNYFTNYLTYFSPDFLFFSGDPNLRHHSGYGGMLLLTQSIFLLFGLLNFSKLGVRNSLFIFAWILLSPSIAALVNETPHASRSIYLMAPLATLTGLGWERIKAQSTSKLVISFITLALIFNLSLYLYDYHRFYPQRSHIAWITPYKKTFEYFKNNPSDKSVYIHPGLYQPGLYAAFYLDANPAELQSSKGEYLKNLNNFSFNLPTTCPQESLCITSPDWQNDSTQIVNQIPGTNILVIKQAK